MDHMDAALSALPWIPVNIGGSKLLAKAWFGDTEYRVLLTDLNNVWDEVMSADRIQSRAQDLNKRLRAPVQAFFARLHSLALPCLTGQSDDQSTGATFMLEHKGSHLTVRLKSELGGVPFYWEFLFSPAPVVLVSKNLVRPLLAMTQALQRQVGELAALLVRKDSEIQDYKDNGAVLARGRLQTEPFDDETFRENFAQRLLQMDKPEHSLEFDSELQKLYVAVSTVKNTQKRKYSESNNISIVPEQTVPDQDLSSNVLTGMRPASPGPSQKKETQSNHSEEVLRVDTSTPVAVPADRSSARPKKKKAVGLFR